VKVFCFVIFFVISVNTLVRGVDTKQRRQMVARICDFKKIYYFQR
jgi:hypothetical protein